MLLRTYARVWLLDVKQLKFTGNPLTFVISKNNLLIFILTISYKPSLDYLNLSSSECI